MNTHTTNLMAASSNHSNAWVAGTLFAIAVAAIVVTTLYGRKNS